MARKSKVDIQEFKRLLVMGKSYGLIARHFGITLGRVSQLKKQQGIEIQKHTQPLSDPSLVHNATQAFKDKANKPQAKDPF